MFTYDITHTPSLAAISTSILQSIKNNVVPHKDQPRTHVPYHSRGTVSIESK